MLKLDPSKVQEFQDSLLRRVKENQALPGEVIRPGDEAYEPARRVWNGMIDRKPAIIVRCAGVSDVIRAVHFARENNLSVAVRGGGHNITGNAVCDDGQVIDLSPMKGIRVDPAARTAWAQAGVSWGEFDQETQAFGLATTGGVMVTTGIAGLTLGGGVGFLMRKFGLTCDNLLSADVVTADGRFLRASAKENSDLFWGLRGGGGNFGIVTSFEFRLHPVGPVVGGMAAWPLVKAREVLRFWRDYTSRAADELTAYAGFLTAPDGTPVVAIAPCYVGPVEEGERAVKPIKEFGPPAIDQIGPMPYVALQSMMEPTFPRGLRNYWKSGFLKGMNDDVIDTIITHCGEALPSPNSMAFIEPMAGAVSRVGRDETAFPHRDAQYNFIILSIWRDVQDDEKNITWTRAFFDAMQPHFTGAVYVNFLGDEGEERVKAAYGEAIYQRLAALKSQYDPTNFFRLNQNIKPARK
jgi:FAD/FMN-containing dehydrogenase